MILAVDIGDSTQGALNEVLRFLPEFVMAIVILIAGYFIAKMVAGVVWRALQRAGLDRTLHGGQAGGFIQKITSSPSRLLGRVVYRAIFLGAASLAISVLGINALTNLMGEIFAYLPNVLAALLIFVVAGAISAGVATLVTKTMGDTPLGKI